MTDHEKAQLVNQLRDIAIAFHATEQLRARIADLVLPALERVEREMIHEGGAAVAEVAQRFATESESLSMQVQALEQAYAQCMARQASTFEKIEAGGRHLGLYTGPSPIDLPQAMLLLGGVLGRASRVNELERACRLLCEAVLVERNPDRIVAPAAFVPAVRAAMLALRLSAPASNAIDWGAVDAELLAILDRYWDVAYGQGREGGLALDSDAATVEACKSELRALLRKVSGQ